MALVFIRKNPKEWRVLFHKGHNFFFFVAAGSCLLFNLWAGICTNRQLFGVELCCIIIILSMLPHHGFSKTWLWVSYTILACFWILQAFNIRGAYQDYSEISKQYERSDDGRVYVDIHTLHRLLRLDSYAHSVEYAFTPTPGYGAWVMQHYFRYLHPDRESLLVLPKALENKDDAVLDNQAIRINDDTYLLIQSKRCPARFNVQEGIDARFFRFPTGTVTLDTLPGYYEGKTWRAATYTPTAAVKSIFDVQILPL